MISRKLALGLGFALAVLASGSARAQALQSSQSSGDCTTDNLIARKVPVWRQDIRGDLNLPTDNAAAPEGAQWDAPVGVILETPAGSLTYDLGSIRPVSSFLLQADANDTYKIFGADVNKPEAFKLLVEIDNVVATPGARLPHADRHHRPHAGALPEGRRAGRRRGLLDRRVSGLLPRAHAVPAEADPHQRAAGDRRRAGVLEVRLVGERRQLAVRDVPGAGGDGAHWLGNLAGQEGAP